MLRTAVALPILGVVVTIAVTAMTGPLWLTLVAVAAGLLLGATALSLIPTTDEDWEVDGGADVRPLVPQRRPPGTGVPEQETGRLGEAA